MELIGIGLLITLVLIVVFRIATHFTYGNFIDRKNEEKFLLLDPEDFELNIYNSNIISHKDWGLGFISSVPLDICCKYYINGVGSIPRWSPLHNRVKEYFASASNKYGYQ